MMTMSMMMVMTMLVLPKCRHCRCRLVLLLLLAVSFLSWTFIFSKWIAIRRARSQTEQFERDFWSGNDLNLLYQGAVNSRHSIGSLERIFEAGFREFSKLRNQRGNDQLSLPRPDTSKPFRSTSARGSGLTSSPRGINSVGTISRTWWKAHSHMPGRRQLERFSSAGRVIINLTR